MKDITQEEILYMINQILQINGIEITDYNEDISTLGISSIDFIQIVVSIEEKYSIEIPDEYLNIFNMNSISKIYDIVSQILSAD